MLTWTIGSGGLIGSAVVRASDRPFVGPTIPWSDPREASVALATGINALAFAADSQPWSIVWAAGAATVSTNAGQAQAEAEQFARFAELVSASSLSQDGVILLVSSAGGVHAGSADPPFDETTPPAPISPYGEARLAQEREAARVLGERWPVVLARLSNVYGPGQDLRKLQGLVSRLAVCSLTREPLNLFVPLSTVRDYIYVDDAAWAITRWLEASAREGFGARVRIIASGEGTSIAQLLRTAQDIGHRRVPLAMGSHPSSSRQATELRFVPSRLAASDRLALTPLPVGMKRVFDDIRRRLQTAVA